MQKNSGELGGGKESKKNKMMGDKCGWLTTTVSLLIVGANYGCFLIKTNFSNYNLD